MPVGSTPTASNPPPATKSRSKVIAFFNICAVKGQFYDRRESIMCAELEVEPAGPRSAMASKCALIGHWPTRECRLLNG